MWIYRIYILCVYIHTHKHTRIYVECCVIICVCKVTIWYWISNWHALAYHSKGGTQSLVLPP